MSSINNIPKAIFFISLLQMLHLMFSAVAVADSIEVSTFAFGQCIGGDFEYCEDNSAGTDRNDSVFFTGPSAEISSDRFAVDSNKREIIGQASSFASANLSTGELKVAARRTGSGTDARATAKIFETLNFDLGINTSAIIQVVLTTHLFYKRQIDSPTLSNPSYSVGFHPSGVPSNGTTISESILNNDEQDIEDQRFFNFTIDQDTTSVDVEFLFSVNTGGVSNVGEILLDGSNTTTIDLITPEGVTWISESGFFLTGETVPEPATLILAGVGLAGLGFARKKRVR